MSAVGPGYLADYLKTNDADRYYASLVLPEGVRVPAQALFAFSNEIASVRARVTAPAPGEIRLQWWRDVLEGTAYGEVNQSPVAEALLGAIATFNLPTAPLVDLVEARRFDLYDDPMPDVPTFEGYAGATVSCLYQLIAMVENQGAPVEAADAAGHLGVAHALVGHLRAFGYNASRSQIFLPFSVLSANGVREADIFSGTSSDGLLAALAQFCEMARTHLELANSAIANLSRPLKPAFAMAGLVDKWLAGLEKGHQNPFAAPTDLADWRKIAILASWRFRKG